MTDQPPFPLPPRQDNQFPAPPPRGPSLGDDFVMAMRFFSRLPILERPHEAPNLSRMAPAVPFASVGIALLPVLLMIGLGLLGVPAYFAAAIGVAAMVIVTGAMPEDALADAADGLFGGATYDRRLDIMKDSRHGSYGVAALALYLILRVAAIGALAGPNVLEAGCIWLATTIIGRSGSLWLSAQLPNAREGGASASAGRVSNKAFTVGAVFAALLAFVLGAPFAGIFGVVVALLFAAGMALFWVWTCRKLVGGQTGDLIGALQALIEVVTLTAFLIFA